MERKLKYHTGANVLEEQERDGVLFLTYPLLEQTKMVKHGFSTRGGGVSEGIFGTMNLSFTRGDNEAAVQENGTLETDTYNKRSGSDKKRLWEWNCKRKHI